MSTRRAQSLPPAAYEKEKSARGRCVSILIVMWKVFACIFSHVTLVTSVVAYCVLGAFTFEKLEADNEIMVKKGIGFIRGNLTDDIWSMTQATDVLHQPNWTMEVLKKIDSFELKIIKEMKEKGWDGNEDEAQLQWTKTGALFYSIIVITTIGYGHIAPKTELGKVTTIFYAILGIPLMLLCLSNIGDIMASSFRFLYWRVCCFVCTREPKKSRRGRSRGGTVRHSNRSRSQGNSLRRSMRNSQRSTDSGIDPYYDGPGALDRAHSDPDFRFPNEPRFYDGRADTTPRSSRNSNPYRGSGGRDRHRDRRGVPREDLMFNQNFENERRPNRFKDPTGSQPRAHSVYRTSENVPSMRGKSQPPRGQSLDRRMMRREPTALDFDPMCKTPVLCNRYAIEEMDRKTDRKQQYVRSQSMPRQSPGYGDRLAVPGGQQRYAINDDDVEQPAPARSKGKRRDRSVPPPPSARIMSPMGFRVNRQTHHVSQAMDDDYDEWDSRSGRSGEVIRPVPIWLCVFLVVSYIIAGAFLFHHWEGWSFLDSAYFCFITLTTIGFGDFVPAKGVSDNSQVSIALCSLYLLFGIALLAMSFNLVQEEVITNVKSVARRLGILKEEEEED